MGKQLSFLDPTLISSADFSPCRKYRYSLWRIWEESKPKVMFVGLNPSTATETINDQTVTRCINYAKDWGFGGFCMANIFAFRATDPKVMRAADDPIGPDNDMWLKKLQCEVELIIAAWGVHGSYLRREKAVIGLFGIDNLKCLGKTINGHPKHPLYLRKDLKPMPF